MTLGITLKIYKMLETFCHKIDLSIMFLESKEMDDETYQIIREIIKEENILIELESKQDWLLDQLEWIVVADNIIITGTLIDK